MKKTFLFLDLSLYGKENLSQTPLPYQTSLYIYISLAKTGSMKMNMCPGPVTGKEELLNYEQPEENSSTCALDPAASHLLEDTTAVPFFLYYIFIFPSLWNHLSSA